MLFGALLYGFFFGLKERMRRAPIPSAPCLIRDIRATKPKPELVALTGVERAGSQCSRVLDGLSLGVSVLAVSTMVRRRRYEAPTCLPGACQDASAANVAGLLLARTVSRAGATRLWWRTKKR
jgi:hypothetical protein